VSPLERRARWLLRSYPAEYRHERGDEIIGTLLEATPDGRAWPRFRDARALAAGGVKARAARNRQRSTATNCRVAVMAGLALYFSLWVTTDVVWFVVTHWHNWSAALSGLLIVATVLLAWAGSRVAVLAAAIVGSAVIVASGLGSSVLVGPSLIEVLGLGGLVVLARDADRPSWRWLWLPGLIIATSALVETGVVFLTVSYAFSRLTLLALVVMAFAALLWIAIDARLMVAVLTYLAVTAIQLLASEIFFGGVDLWSLLPLLVIASLLVPSVWLLRWQSARPVRTA
jgi:hypothetical protein